MTETRTTDTEPKKMRPWIRVLFGVSLSLNLLVIAAATAMFARWDGDRYGRDHHPAGGAVTLIRALPDSHRIQLRDAFERHDPGDRAARTASRRQQFQDILLLLSVEPFDAAGFEAVLNQQADKSEGRLTGGAAALTEVIDQMTEAERATYLEEVKRLAERRRRQHR
ncbi:periplasmic heavy metal sensor [Thalassobius sp. I31.1]|uniref:periplasmic heavy metal sensor n=1 Tax=Thalassobius sp. I31.1 TaxID=2109912 RepID=UPI001300B0B5|nr:periplasmic heavy metal sensor [Thalassobius sp. I31.1]